MNNYLKYIYPILWLSVIVYGSIIPSDKIAEFNLFKHSDKVIHFIFYAVLTILTIPLIAKHNKYVLAFLVSCMFSVVTGLFFEYLQHAMSLGRTASVADIIANAAGSVFGIFVYNFLIKRKLIERLLFRI